MREKQEKRKLEERIDSLQSQLLVGGAHMEETPAFRAMLQQEQRRIRHEYEGRLKEMEAERSTVEEGHAQVGRCPYTGQMRNSCIPRSLPAKISLYNHSGVDFKCPYSNRPLKPSRFATFFIAVCFCQRARRWIATRSFCLSSVTS
jgi:hypothetical protein